MENARTERRSPSDPYAAETQADGARAAPTVDEAAAMTRDLAQPPTTRRALQPGAYVLRLEARAGAPSAVRDIPFTLAGKNR
jgi:hypothetical protein